MNQAHGLQLPLRGLGTSLEANGSARTTAEEVVQLNCDGDAKIQQAVAEYPLERP